MLLVLLALSVVMAASVQANPPLPQTPPGPPLAVAESGLAPAGTAPLAPRALDLPPFTAVLIVGPIDGDYGSWTTQEKQNMELAAAELEANGVTVHRFYTPNNDWGQITAAAEGAQFLFYRGHGVYWSAMPNPTVGGFALHDSFVSSEQIRTDLELAPNAIVMLYGCFTAGSSSIDNPPIDSAEAQRRVAQYSDPFFDIGAAGYYANWFGDAFQKYVRTLFQGLTLQDAYESFYDFNSATVERTTHPDHPELAMWLDKDFWDGKWQYNNAFSGLPDETLASLFNVTTMELSASTVGYMAEPAYPPRSTSVSVESSTSEMFTWTATVSPGGPSWLDVTPLSGNSGEQITITLTPAALPYGTYQANIRVLADSPEIENHDQTIAVTLYVVERVHFTYLPLVSR
jgi:hypothetical protein